MEPYQIADLGITRTFQNIRLFKNLTVLENVLTACHTQREVRHPRGPPAPAPATGARRRALRRKAEELLEHHGPRATDATIAGQQPALRRCSAAWRSPAPWPLDPKLLLLDEPAAGMNPDETEQLMQPHRARSATRFKLSVLVIEHHMDLVMGVCEQHRTCSNFGSTIAEGTPDEIRQRSQGRRGLPGHEEGTDMLTVRRPPRTPTAASTPCKGVSLEVEQGRDRHHHRRQRGRQVHHCSTPSPGSSSPAPGDDPLPGQELLHQAGRTGSCKRRHLPRARGPADLRQPHRARTTSTLGAYLRNDKDGIAADLEKVYGLFPRLKERLQADRAAPSPAASSRCWPWAGPS
ncbi:MAG: hypothetical protein MZV64_09395 [Ignavibacteriales bacterium]|nr:hypothetical protein [Ignavibacteriales bacterium]